MAGFNHARIITKASATGLYGRQDDCNKEICSLGSLVSNPVRYDSLYASFSLKGQVILDFSSGRKGPILFFVFFNQHRNKTDLHKNLFKTIALSHFCTGPDPLLFQVCSPLQCNIYFFLL